MLYLLSLVSFIQANQDETVFFKKCLEDLLDFYILDFWMKLPLSDFNYESFSEYLAVRDPELYSSIDVEEYLEDYYESALPETVNRVRFATMISRSYFNTHAKSTQIVEEYYGLMEEIANSAEFEVQKNNMDGSVAYLGPVVNKFNKAQIFRPESRTFIVDQPLEKHDKFADLFYEEIIIEDVD
jgi:hypothetical protein